MRPLNYENGSGGMRTAQQRLTQNNATDFTRSQRNPSLTQNRYSRGLTRSGNGIHLLEIFNFFNDRTETETLREMNNIKPSIIYKSRS